MLMYTCLFCRSLVELRQGFQLGKSWPDLKARPAQMRHSLQSPLSPEHQRLQLQLWYAFCLMLVFWLSDTKICASHSCVLGAQQIIRQSFHAARKQSHFSVLPPTLVPSTAVAPVAGVVSALSDLALSFD